MAGIDHLGINVPDLQQAEAFLAQTFGCRSLTHIGPFPTATGAGIVRLAMVRCGSGANIELFEYGGARNATSMVNGAPRGADPGATHIAFYTDDVPAGVAYLKAHGITVLGEPVSMTAGATAGETWVHFLAPWGAEMELVGYPLGKAYERAGGDTLWNPNFPAR